MLQVKVLVYIICKSFVSFNCTIKPCKLRPNCTLVHQWRRPLLYDKSFSNTAMGWFEKSCLGLCHNKGYDIESNEYKEQPVTRLGNFQKDLYMSANSERKIFQEYYIYDGLAMVGSIGGSLGLFIGFSFFDFLCLVLDFLSEKYQGRRNLGCKSCNYTPNFCQK